MARSYTNTRAPSPLVSNRLLRKFPFGRPYLRLRNTRYALINRRLLLNEENPVCLDVLVVSPGGSGSTELIKHIAKYFDCNSLHDRDGLKHLPTPPAPEIAEKIIFVHRDFEGIRKSLKGRNSVRAQLRKLRPDGLPFGSKEYRSLEALVEMQARAFAQNSRVETLFIHFNELFESAQIIADFLGDTEGFVENFPKRRVGSHRPEISPNL